MPQLSLYVTEKQLAVLKNEASAQKVSVSKWVVSRVMDRLDAKYPEGWSELFGSVGDKTFRRPVQPVAEVRETL